MMLQSRPSNAETTSFLFSPFFAVVVVLVTLVTRVAVVALVALVALVDFCF